MNRKKYLNIRISEEELEVLKEHATKNYMSLAQFARKLIFANIK